MRIQHICWHLKGYVLERTCIRIYASVGSQMFPSQDGIVSIAEQQEWFLRREKCTKLFECYQGSVGVTDL